MDFTDILAANAAKQDTGFIGVCDYAFESAVHLESGFLNSA